MTIETLLPIDPGQPSGCIEVNGALHYRNGEGHLVPADMVKPQHALEDQLVRRVIGFAAELSDRIGRFKGHVADDVATFQQLLEEKYRAPRKGGKRGNVTFASYDGLQRIEVRMADDLVFGPELQTAKSLIDACISGWAAEANAPIRLLVNRAFSVDQAGRINRNAILSLRTVEIEDERWQRAMAAITDSIRIVGRRTYFRFARRADLDSPWVNITIDLAAASAPQEAASHVD